MKTARQLTLLAVIVLFSCSEKEDLPPDVALTGTWMLRGEIRTITTETGITVDTVSYTGSRKR